MDGYTMILGNEDHTLNLQQISKSKVPVVWIGFVLLEIAVPIIFFLRTMMHRESKEKATIQRQKKKQCLPEARSRNGDEL